MSLKSYTRFVLFGKHALWVLAALLVIMLVWVANYNSGENGKRIVFTNMAQTEIIQNIMGKPHYQGLDAKNQPFTVTAEKATQLDENRVSLDAIRAELSRHDGTWLALNARNGIYNGTEKKLDLTGGVEIFTGDGYQIFTDHAYVDINAGSAYGDAKIEGQGARGTLQANSFVVENRGQLLRFKGNVKMKVYRE